MMRLISFLQSTDSNANLGTITDISKNILLALWASFSPLKLAHKINHHIFTLEELTVPKQKQVGRVTKPVGVCQ